jgi:hypothetical protein
MSSLPLPPLQCPFSNSTPLLCVSFQFLVYCSVFCLFFFCGWGGQSAQGAMLVYPMGDWGNTAWCLVFICWSAECFPSRFRAGVWWWQEPSCFLSAVQHGEAFHVLGIHGVEGLILLGALFRLSMAQVSPQILHHFLIGLFRFGDFVFFCFWIMCVS